MNTLPHQVRLPVSVSELAPILQWCNLNISEECDVWTWWKQLDYPSTRWVFAFADESSATMFALRWL